MRSYVKVIYQEYIGSDNATHRALFNAPPRENDSNTFMILRPRRAQLILAFNNLAQSSVEWQLSPVGQISNDPWTLFEMFYAIEPYKLHPLD